VHPQLAAVRLCAGCEVVGSTHHRVASHLPQGSRNHDAVGVAYEFIDLTDD
jgi:hypothetical protein